MPKCEECGKETNRRVAFIRADEKKMVCKECEEKLGIDYYRLLCEFIVDKHRRI